MIQITAGDAGPLEITLYTNSVPVDLTGATFESEAVDTDGEEVVIADDKHTANPDQVTCKGMVTVRLESAVSATFREGRSELLITATQNGDPVTFRVPMLVLPKTARYIAS